MADLLLVFSPPFLRHKSYPCLAVLQQLNAPVQEGNLLRDGEILLTSIENTS